MWRILLRKFSASSVETQVADILKRFNTVDPSKISSTATFQELGLDDLDAVEAVVEMEEVLGHQLSEEDAFKIKTVQDAVNAFSKHKKN